MSWWSGTSFRDEEEVEEGEESRRRENVPRSQLMSSFRLHSRPLRSVQALATAPLLPTSSSPPPPLSLCFSVTPAHSHVDLCKERVCGCGGCDVAAQTSFAKCATLVKDV